MSIQIETQRPAGAATAVLHVDVAARTVQVENTLLQLTSREYGLLLVLVSEPTRVFTKEELLREVWGIRAVHELRTRTLDSHACRLRARLAEAGFEGIANVWGVGYRLLHHGGDPHLVQVDNAPPRKLDLTEPFDAVIAAVRKLGDLQVQQATATANLLRALEAMRRAP